jgi:hypothetical protein
LLLEHLAGVREGRCDVGSPVDPDLEVRVRDRDEFKEPASIQRRYTIQLNQDRNAHRVTIYLSHGVRAHHGFDRGLKGRRIDLRPGWRILPFSPDIGAELGNRHLQQYGRGQSLARLVYLPVAG